MKFHFIHKWEVLSDNGFTKYRECAKCNKREVIQPSFGYQPIDKDWLNGLRPFIGFDFLLELKLKNWQRINLQEV